MLLFFKLKINLGFRLPKGRTIPIEQFIPQGIYGYAVFAAVFGYFGLMLLQLSLPWYFIVPADIAMGFIVNFIGCLLYTSERASARQRLLQLRAIRPQRKLPLPTIQLRQKLLLSNENR